MDNKHKQAHEVSLKLIIHLPELTKLRVETGIPLPIVSEMFSHISFDLLNDGYFGSGMDGLFDLLEEIDHEAAYLTDHGRVVDHDLLLSVYEELTNDFFTRILLDRLQRIINPYKQTTGYEYCYIYPHGVEVLGDNYYANDYTMLVNLIYEN